MSESQINFTSQERIDAILEENIRKGLGEITSKLGELDIKVESQKWHPVPKKAEPRYSQYELAEVARSIYRSNIKPVVEEKKEEKVEQPDTIASRANARALARSLVGLRNGGNEGRLSPLAGPNGGNTGNPNCGSGTYFALTTSMSTEEYEEHLKEKYGLSEKKDSNPCWTGYERKPGTKKFDKGSCVKESVDYIETLEDALLLLEDTSWQSIDKVMRSIAYENGITPKQLHKEFKATHGMIPDAWLEENVNVESVGWMPLDEAVRINKIGQVMEVSFMFRGGTQRLKFFWPEAGMPSRDDMQKACQKFWPGARLLAFYPSHDPGDQQNMMVIIPALTENFEVIDHTIWDFMSEEDTEAYDDIAAEVGEPVSAVFLTEDEDAFEVVVADHDTGEERVVVFGEGKRGLWDNIHAKRKRGEKPAKPGEKGYPKTLKVEEVVEAPEKVGKKQQNRSVDLNKKAKDKAYAKFGGKPPWMKEEAEIQEDSRRISNKQHTQRVRSNIKSFGDNYTPPNNWDPDANRGKGEVVTPKQMEKKRRKALRQEELEYVPEDMSGMSQKSGDKRSTESGAGMTAKGVAKYNRRTGGNLKTAVTTPPSKLKAGSKAANRRKSFCARSRGWTGERGKAARRRWNC